jgi:hypothetical protein
VDWEVLNVSKAHTATRVFKTAVEASKAVAARIAEIIRQKAAAGKPAVLGLEHCA